jgi:hypothetical protein
MSPPNNGQGHNLLLVNGLQRGQGQSSPVKAMIAKNSKSKAHTNRRVDPKIQAIRRCRVPSQFNQVAGSPGWSTVLAIFYYSLLEAGGDGQGRLATGATGG